MNLGKTSDICHSYRHLSHVYVLLLLLTIVTEYNHRYCIYIIMMTTRKIKGIPPSSNIYLCVSTSFSSLSLTPALVAQTLDSQLQLHLLYISVCTLTFVAVLLPFSFSMFFPGIYFPLILAHVRTLWDLFFHPNSPPPPLNLNQLEFIGQTAT